MRAFKAICCLQMTFVLLGCRAANPCIPRSDAPFAHPSQLVSLGERRINLRCMGTGNPTIVLEAGLGGDSSTWVLVQPRLAELTRVCSYDRAGYYFSDP